ncbi:MAG: TetR family transcriptional regulator [Actinobacteria bacterium]|nr:TetR family transcriptional regulator [Actinomycetota bacterium]
MNNADVKPRRYESRLRKAHAADTRRRIVEAALDAFIADGYRGATMQKIARSAGVVVETIYRSFEGKSGLFKAAVEAAVAGGIERAERPVEARPAIRAVMEEKDPRRKLELYLKTQPGINERLAPLYRALGQAAAVDARAEQVLEDVEAQRLAGMQRFISDLAEVGGLREGMTLEDARDTLWTVTSHDVYRLLVIKSGWALNDYERWLIEVLTRSFLP